MSFSKETERKIERFAAEQSEKYLSQAEMTYLEKLRKKARGTRARIGERLAKFKAKSAERVDAQNDLALYMNDCMSDLIAQGMTEQEAFEKAKAELAAPDSEQARELQERWVQYYQNKDVAEQEAVGLLYGGFLFLGIAVGGLVGFLASGGVPAFTAGGWIYTLVGIGVGVFVGIALGLIGNAVITIMNRR